jgi:Ca2+-binding EF-hand superfamily protein
MSNSDLDLILSEDVAIEATENIKRQLEIVLKHLNCEIDSENLVELFEYSDVDHSNKINLKEFLVALIVEYILGKLNKDIFYPRD